MRYAIRLHSAVQGDLARIGRTIGDDAGAGVARHKLGEIRETVVSHGVTPHRGTLHDAIATGLRTIPAGRRGAVIFTVDDAARAVNVHAICDAGADWIATTRRRTKP